MTENQMTELKSQFEGIRDEFIKSGDELKASTAKELERLQTELDALAAKANRPQVESATKSLGELVVEADGYANVQKGLVPSTGRVAVKSFANKAVTSGTAYIPAQQLGIVVPASGVLGVRGLMPNLPATSGTFEFARATFTNSAATQGVGTSPLTRENVAKAESDLSFSLVTSSVYTIAHWIAVSKQALADSGQLAGLINAQLYNGLKVKEEQQLIAGSGAAGQMLGLVSQATAYNTGLNPSSPTSVDKLRMALFQASTSNYNPSGIVLNPQDWATIELLKNGVNGGYLFANPQAKATPTLWGLPVVTSNALTQGTFLVGAFDSAAAVYDREDATIEVTNSHSDFFVKNMAAALAEERLGLAVFVPGAFITGSF